MLLKNRSPFVQLTRDEIALIEFYRGLTPEKQLELLETAENGANVILRMRELAGRFVEQGFFDNETRLS